MSPGKSYYPTQILIVIELVFGFVQGVLLVLDFFLGCLLLMLTLFVERVFFVMRQGTRRGCARLLICHRRSTRRRDNGCGRLLHDDARGHEMIGGAGVLNRQRTPRRDAVNRNRRAGFVNDRRLFRYAVTQRAGSSFAPHDHGLRTWNVFSESPSCRRYAGSGLRKSLARPKASAYGKQSGAQYGEFFVHIGDSYATATVASFPSIICQFAGGLNLGRELATFFFEWSERILRLKKEARAFKVDKKAAGSRPLHGFRPNQSDRCAKARAALLSSFS